MRTLSGAKTMPPKSTTFGSGNVLSIDIASRKYADNGFAFLSHDSNIPEFIKSSELDLTGPPYLADFAFAINEYCEQREVTVLLLDGPQGWKSPKTKIEHMRLCERVLNTPAKTGTIGHVKPKTFLRYIAFSISLFHILRVDYKWNLLTEDWYKSHPKRWIVESFPSSAWLTLGLEKLPSKSKTKPRQLSKWKKDLSLITGYEMESKVTHDELQAAVVLPAGRAIAEGNPEGVILSGMDPTILRSGDVLEGWIVNPLVVDP
jgi:hypothetical protein